MGFFKQSIVSHQASFRRCADVRLIGIARPPAQGLNEVVRDATMSCHCGQYENCGWKNSLELRHVPKSA